MKIPFYKLFSLFKTFKVDSDTKYLESLLERGVVKAMVIKRSWLFGLFSSWILLAIGVLSGINIYNIVGWSGPVIVEWIFSILIAISYIFLVYSSIVYIYKFRKTYAQNVEKDIEEILLDLKEGDSLFIDFFNQITTNINLFGIIIISGIAYSIINVMSGTDGNVYSIVIVGTSLLLQIFMMRHYRKEMIDLEMDYNIVFPWGIYFANQSGVFKRTGIVIEAKEIAGIKAAQSGFFYSLFDHGGINVEMVGENADSPNDASQMNYILHPKETVSEIHEILKYKAPEITNSYLKWILESLQIPSDQYRKEKNLITLLKFLKENDSLVQSDYKGGDLIKKVEIKEIYTIISNTKL